MGGEVEVEEAWKKKRGRGKTKNETEVVFEMEKKNSKRKNKKKLFLSEQAPGESRGQARDAADDGESDKRDGAGAVRFDSFEPPPRAGCL